MFDSYIEDVFGKRYILKQQSELTTQQSFKPLRFTDESQAFQFLKRLRVPVDFWQRSVGRISHVPFENSKSANFQTERQVSKLLYRKQLSIFELQNFGKNSGDSQKRSVEQSNGDKYTFSHVSTLLVSAPLKLIDINSKADAEKLLQDLSPDNQQLNQIAKELNLSTLDNTDSAATSKLIVEAMVANDVVVSVQKKLASPPMPTKESEVAAADKPVALGPEAAVAVAAPVTVDAMSNVNQKSQAETLKKASEDGKPFCEECEKAKAEQAS